MTFDQAMAVVVQFCYVPGREREAKKEATIANMHFEAPFWDSRTKQLYACNSYVCVCVALDDMPADSGVPDLDETPPGERPYWEQVRAMFRGEPAESLNEPAAWPEPDPEQVGPCEACGGKGCPICYGLGLLPANWWTGPREKVKDRVLGGGYVVGAASAMLVDVLPRPLQVAVKAKDTANGATVAYLKFDGGGAIVPAEVPEDAQTNG